MSDEVFSRRQIECLLEAAERREEVSRTRREATAAIMRLRVEIQVARRATAAVRSVFKTPDEKGL